LAQAMAAGIESLIGRVRARIGSAELIVQVDEPHALAVMAGTVSTVSGYAQHTAFDETRTDALLRAFTAAIRQAGATPAVHCCVPDPPVDAFIAAGFSAIAFEPFKPDDRWARAIDKQVRLWPQVEPIQDSARRSLETFVGALGFSLESVHEQLVVTPPCGLDSLTLHDAKI